MEFIEYSFRNAPVYILIKNISGENNIIRLSRESLLALKEERLKIKIAKQGRNNTISNVSVSIAAVSGNINISLGHDNASVFISENVQGVYDFRLWRDSKIFIGARNTSNGIRVVCDDSEFITGKDCMFSNNVVVQSADQHGIVDLATGDIINNKNKSTIIGDHVWLGWATTLMSDVTVGTGSVVATGSVVTKNIPAFCVVAGVPARVIRHQTTWSRSPVVLDELSKIYTDNFNAGD